MQTYDKWDQEEFWQRVVDGLSTNELAEFLAACERRPELWKRCALELLEEQALTRELNGLSSHWPLQHQWRPDSAAGETPELDPALAQSSVSPSTTESSHVPAPLPRKSFGTAQWFNSLAFAASVLLAFLVGGQASRRVANWSTNSPALPSGRLANTAIPNSTGNLDTGVSRTSALGSAVGSGQGSAVSSNMLVVERPTPEAIDRVNAAALTQAIQAGDGLDWETRYNELRRRGYEVHSQGGIMPVWLDDGSSAVVPYQQIKVRPKQNAY
ncbi:MAG: hypothetical protein IT423_00725 [Pirellulaceae bacterium]|nr:hypothetical protein [Pirellulaceae bacterium]